MVYIVLITSEWNATLERVREANFSRGNKPLKTTTTTTVTSQTLTRLCRLIYRMNTREEPLCTQCESSHLRISYLIPTTHTCTFVKNLTLVVSTLKLPKMARSRVKKRESGLPGFPKNHTLTNKRPRRNALNLD